MTNLAPNQLVRTPTKGAIGDSGNSPLPFCHVDSRPLERIQHLKEPPAVGPSCGGSAIYSRLPLAAVAANRTSSAPATGAYERPSPLCHTPAIAVKVEHPSSRSLTGPALSIPPASPRWRPAASQTACEAL